MRSRGESDSWRGDAGALASQEVFARGDDRGAAPRRAFVARRAVLRGVGAAVGALLTGCRRDPGDSTEARAPEVIDAPSGSPGSEGQGAASTSEAGARDRGIIAALRARAVFDDDFARRRFYSWTTTDRAAALAAGGPRMTADADSGGRPTPYVRALKALAEAGREASAAVRAVARRILDEPSLRRHRYAWTSAYATALGLGPRRYGDELIVVDLDAAGIILRFSPGAAEPLVAADLEGRPRALDEVLAAPERVAAVLHVRVDEVGAPYREFVLCNPARIAGFAVRTPTTAAALAEERALLEALAAGPFAWLPGAAVDAPAAPTWRERDGAVDAVALWRASLAFDTPRYRPSVGNLRRLVAALADAEAKLRGRGVARSGAASP